MSTCAGDGEVPLAKWGPQTAFGRARFARGHPFRQRDLPVSLAICKLELPYEQCVRSDRSSQTRPGSLTH
jgi:hypothetical protein